MFSNRRLVVQSALFYFPKLISGIGGYLAFSLLFRVKGAADYGDYILIIAYWNIPAILAGDIVGTSGQKLLAEVSAKGGSEVKRAFASVWLIHAAAVAFFGVLGVALLPLANRYVFNSAFLANHVAWGLLLYFGAASLTFFRYVLRGMHLYWQTLIMDLTESILRNGLWIATCLGVAFGLSLTGGAAIALLGAATVIYGLLLRRGIRPGQGKIDPEHRQEIAFQAKAMSLIYVCTYALNSVPAVVLNRFHGAEAVGLYAALFRIVDISTGPIMSLAYILVPTAAGAKLKGENEVRGLLTRSFKVYILSLPFVVCLGICRGEVVNLFGLGKYPEATQILLAFCVWVMFGNISALFGSFADFLGYAHARARLMLIFAVVFCTVAVYCAAHGDVVLVAWGTTFAYALMVSSFIGLIIHYHSSGFIRHNLSLLFRVSFCVVIAAVLARYGWPSTEVQGFRENMHALILRSLSFGAVTVGLGSLVAVRREQGRFTIR